MITVVLTFAWMYLIWSMYRTIKHLEAKVSEQKKFIEGDARRLANRVEVLEQHVRRMRGTKG